MKILTKKELVANKYLWILTEKIEKYLQKNKINKNSIVVVNGNLSIKYLCFLFALWKTGAITAHAQTKDPKSNMAIWANKLCFKLNTNGPATITKTSGSNGESKNVLHSLYSHFASAKHVAENTKLTSDCCWALSLPLFHVSGLSIFFRSMLKNGKVFVPTKEKTSKVLVKKEITHISLVLTQLRKFIEKRKIKKALRKTKAILLGGSAVSKSLMEKIKKIKIPVMFTYGSTEMASQISSTDFATPKGPKILHGKVLPGRFLKISKYGEILVGGKMLADGYVKEGEIKKIIDNNGLFRTNDVGKITQNKNLKIIKRKDSMLISGGENIQPKEIEEAIRSFYGILNVKILMKKDPKYKDRPVAFIEKENKSEIIRKDLILHMKNHIAKFKIPDEFYCKKSKQN